MRTLAPVPISLLIVHRFFLECDGVIHSTIEEYEPEALKGWRDWLPAKPIFTLGGLSPRTSDKEIAEAVEKNEVYRDVQGFLDKALSRCGPKSAIFISFGTIFWPAEPEKIWAVLEILMERKIPFVRGSTSTFSTWLLTLYQLFSHAAPNAVITDGIKEKLDAYDLAYHAPFLPQQMILQHKVRNFSLRGSYTYM